MVGESPNTNSIQLRVLNAHPLPHVVEVFRNILQRFKSLVGSKIDSMKKIFCFFLDLFGISGHVGAKRRTGYGTVSSAEHY